MDALAYVAAATSGSAAKFWTVDDERKLITHMAQAFDNSFDVNQIFPILSEKSLGEIKEKWKSITSVMLTNLSSAGDQSEEEFLSCQDDPTKEQPEEEVPNTSMPPQPSPQPPPPPVVSRAYPQNVPAFSLRTLPLPTKRKYPEPPQPIHAPPTKKKQGRPPKPVVEGLPWEDDDAAHLVKLMENYQDGKSPQWDEIASNFPGRTAVDCLTQWHKMIPTVRGKGSWTAEEDAMLISKHAAFGRKWSKISDFLPGRAGKQCRERFVNHLDPNLKKGAEWTDDEEAILISLHKNHGNKWTLIANQLHGRSDNDVKNHFNSTISRKFQVHGRDRLVEAAIQQVQMLIKAGMVPSDLLTKRPSVPMTKRDLSKVPVVSKKGRHDTFYEPPQKTNFIPPRQGYPVADYNYSNFPHPGAPGYHPRMVSYHYQYHNHVNALPAGPTSSVETSPQQGEALPSGVTASAETEPAEDRDDTSSVENDEEDAPTLVVEQEQEVETVSA